MNKSVISIVVCAAGPLLALAMGAPVAWAAPGDTHGATVSINGDTKHGATGSTASSGIAGSGNIAVAVNGSTAIASSGTNNTAIAVNGSTATIDLVGPGSNNTAMAVNGSTASAGSPATQAPSGVDNSTARAFCGGSAKTAGAETVVSHGTCGKG
jgi:hypothetical protein